MPEIRGPCLGCGRRKPGCHSRCADYKEYRARLDEYNAVVREAKIAAADLRNEEIEAKRRMTKRMRKWKKRGWTR